MNRHGIRVVLSFFATVLVGVLAASSAGACHGPDGSHHGWHGGLHHDLHQGFHWAPDWGWHGGRHHGWHRGPHHDWHDRRQHFWPHRHSHRGPGWHKKFRSQPYPHPRWAPKRPSLGRRHPGGKLYQGWQHLRPLPWQYGGPPARHGRKHW